MVTEIRVEKMPIQDKELPLRRDARRVQTFPDTVTGRNIFSDPDTKWLNEVSMLDSEGLEK